MTTFFISDLHLQEEKPKITASFLNFLSSYEVVTADAIYILGDLFDVWIGDDNDNKLYSRVASAIKNLVNCGVPCYFIHGNRDFLISQNFARKSGLTFLSEEQTIEIYGYKILIMHGDTIYSHNFRYRIFRTGVRISWIQKVFLSLPLSIRNKIAKKIRSNSRRTINYNNFLPSYVIRSDILHILTKIMKKHQVNWLICGHIHRPNIYKFTINNQPAFHYVLGKWHDNNSSIVKVTSKSVNLLHIFFN